MPYCSLEEAWAPVSYPNSDLYGSNNESIYKNNCSAEPKEKRMKYLGRTNQRLAQRNGPINRVPNYKNQVLKSKTTDFFDETLSLKFFHLLLFK